MILKFDSNFPCFVQTKRHSFFKAKSKRYEVKTIKSEKCDSGTVLRVLHVLQETELYCKYNDRPRKGRANLVEAHLQENVTKIPSSSET